MKTTNHISFEELTGNIAGVFNQVREERKTVVVEYANGEQVVIKRVRTPAKPVPSAVIPMIRTVSTKG